MRNKILLTMIIAILLIGIAGATVQDLGNVKTGQCIQLVQSYTNSTYTTLVSVQLPDKTIKVINSSMQSNGAGFYNYTFCNTTELGSLQTNNPYIYSTCTDVDGANPCISVSETFGVTQTGSGFNTQQSILYVAAMLIAIFLFTIAVIGGFAIPWGNDRNEMTGYIIQVSNKKYLKIACWCAAYLLMLLIMYFSYIISIAYLNIDFLASLFNFVFIVMAWGCIPGFILMAYFLIANMVRDSKLGDMITNGLRVREGQY